MNEDSTVLDYYRSMARASRAMLHAARGDDWDEVVRLERDCAAMVAHLKAMGDGSARLSTAERDQKVDLIRAILADDAAIRELAEPWLADLGRKLDAAGAQRKLDRAYG